MGCFSGFPVMQDVLPVIQGESMGSCETGCITGSQTFLHPSELAPAKFALRSIQLAIECLNFILSLLSKKKNNNIVDILKQNHKNHVSARSLIH